VIVYIRYTGRHLAGRSKSREDLQKGDFFDPQRRRSHFSDGRNRIAISLRDPANCGAAVRDLLKLNVEIGLTICDYTFPIIAESALGEDWTRDPFDRIVVAHA